jgi:hypothetical protein
MCPIERDIEVFRERFDRVGVLLVGIAVARPHDDAAE